MITTESAKIGAVKEFRSSRRLQLQAAEKDRSRQIIAGGSLADIVHLFDDLADKAKLKKPQGTYKIFRIIGSNLPIDAFAIRQKEVVSAAKSKDPEKSRIGQRALFFLNINNIVRKVDSIYEENFLDIPEDKDGMADAAVDALLEVSVNGSATGNQISEIIDSSLVSYLDNKKRSLEIESIREEDIMGDGEKEFSSSRDRPRRKGFYLITEMKITSMGRNKKHLFEAIKSRLILLNVVQVGDLYKREPEELLKEWLRTTGNKDIVKIMVPVLYGNKLRGLFENARAGRPLDEDFLSHITDKLEWRRDILDHINQMPKNIPPEEKRRRMFTFAHEKDANFWIEQRNLLRR